MRQAEPSPMTTDPAKIPLVVMDVSVHVRSFDVRRPWAIIGGYGIVHFLVVCMVVNHPTIFLTPCFIY